MADLTDFGGGVETDDGVETDVGRDDSADRMFAGARCRVIKLGEGTRCRGDVTGPMADREAGLCPHHAQTRAPVTIDDDPAQLIGATSGHVPTQFADEIAGWPRIRAALEETSDYQWERNGDD